MTTIRSLKGIAFIPVFAAVVAFIAWTIVGGLTFHMPRQYTIEQKVLRAIGGGAYWRGDGMAMTGAGVPAFVVASKSAVAVILVPADQGLDKRIVTDLGGRKAEKWVEEGKSAIALGGNATQYSFINYFGDAQWTLFFNTSVNRTEILLS